MKRMIETAVAPLKARIAELEAEIARLKKNSATSSKPPSSDVVKPPKPKPTTGGRRRKRRGGGQPGHPRHTRPPFPPEQVELVEKPYQIIEHRARLYRNRRTGQVLAAALPMEVRRAGGQDGAEGQCRARPLL